MPNFKRTDRIAETLRRELAQIIQLEIKPARLTGLVTLSAVNVSRDLGHAKVYFTIFNGDPQEAAVVLNASAPQLRMLLAKAMILRVVPQLHFVFDESLEYGQRLSRIIDDVNAADDGNESE